LRAGSRVVIVSVRPERPGDEPFLRELILETVAQELGAHAWPQPMRDHLLSIQFQARRAGVKTLYPDGSSQIIRADGKSAGWLFVSDSADRIRIVEIMILAGNRGRGIGSTVIRGILASAAQARKPVRMGVNATNYKAMRLYGRLGFQKIGGDEVQYEMEWCGGELSC